MTIPFESLFAAQVLGEDGLLAQVIPGFAARQSQQRMAEAVEYALDHCTTLVCEAGTGTGKTFAYLVPALLSERKIILSTGTKTLQDQLFQRDLPTVRKALGKPVSVALLKGRANYLCQARLSHHSHPRDLFGGNKLVNQWQMVKEWAGRTQSGDIAEVHQLSEQAEIWSHVTSTADNCTGQDCAHYNECFLLKARRKANEVDLVIVNHHLFFADLALREEGVGELLPGAEAVILDEAHQLAEIATHFFGTQFSARQVDDLVNDSIDAQHEEAADETDIQTAAYRLSDRVRDIRQALGEERQRAAFEPVRQNEALQNALQNTHDALASLIAILKTAKERGKKLANCSERAVQMAERLRMITHEPPDEHVAWFETFSRNFMLTLTPLNIANIFQSARQTDNRAWVFTSATLSVAEDFSHFTRELGLEDSTTLRLESPFDFRHHALFYVPEDLPQPSAEDFTARMVESALPVLHQSRGRAFLLFTSHRALNIAASLLEKAGLPYPLLVQGSQGRNLLLSQFRDHGNAILLGTSSFWEGVDVRGEALSCVIIDKLPFASPGDPILEARIQQARRNGGNPFTELQLPKAVITLKQGVGRLIRDVTDRGLLMLCDRRIVEKPYGRLFLDSLPPMPKTRKLDVVKRFFALEQPGVQKQKAAPSKLLQPGRSSKKRKSSPRLK